MADVMPSSVHPVRRLYRPRPLRQRRTRSTSCARTPARGSQVWFDETTRALGTGCGFARCARESGRSQRRARTPLTDPPLLDPLNDPYTTFEPPRRRYWPGKHGRSGRGCSHWTRPPNKRDRQSRLAERTPQQAPAKANLPALPPAAQGGSPRHDSLFGPPSQVNIVQDPTDGDSSESPGSFQSDTAHSDMVSASGAPLRFIGNESSQKQEWSASRGQFPGQQPWCSK